MKVNIWRFSIRLLFIAIVHNLFLFYFLGKGIHMFAATLIAGAATISIILFLEITIVDPLLKRYRKKHAV